MLGKQIREAGESRGFAVSRLLTHWAEVAGPEIAAIARPVEVSYGRAGIGATLTVLTSGAQAPMLEMQKETLRERVNACYGYSAISRIRITQTSAHGFAEPRAEFAPAPSAQTHDPALQARAEKAVAPVQDDGLKAALAALGENILKRKTP
ncbi:MAG: DUF721 domain-containing protein [Rhodobacteraceae bacterium]|nr:DUF721 domain-containing protein [Paracoccaceae bacterium]